MFPTKIFGENDRIVCLTAREHFMAHLLLWKGLKRRYGMHHWKTAKAGKAVQAMSMNSKLTQQREQATSRSFELARIANSESMSGDNHWSRQEGAVNPFVALNKDPVRAKRIGKLNGDREKERWENGEHQWQTPEAIEARIERMQNGQAALMGSKMKGKLWWNNGTEQTRAFECPGEGWVRGRLPFDCSKLVEYCKSEEGRSKNRQRNTGKKLSEEHKQAISIGATKRKS